MIGRQGADLKFECDISIYIKFKIARLHLHAVAGLAALVRTVVAPTG